MKQITPKIRKIFFISLETIGLCLIMLLAIFPVSCRVTVSGLEIIGADCKVPVLEKYEILDTSRISMTFSDKVTLLSAGVTKENDTDDEEESRINMDYEVSDDGKTVLVHLAKDTKIGTPYIFTGEVETPRGSSLTFSYRFTGFNNSIPALVLTEIMDETRSWTKDKINHKVYEFIEFYALSDGNLSGLRVTSLNDGDTKAYSFPPVDVKAGDFITLHFRKSTFNPDECLDETNSDITFSKGEGSSDQAWDFWVDNTESRLGLSQDIILLENINSSTVLQALLYSKEEKTEWSKDSFTDAASRCIENGLWTPDSTTGSAVTYKKNPNIIRNNLTQIIEAYSQNKIWPLPSNKDEWTVIECKNYSPGYMKVLN